jgi:hypothetical protein
VFGSRTIGQLTLTEAVTAAAAEMVNAS